MCALGATPDMTHRLLLVEPSATMRYVLEKHAQSLGFAVHTAESYESALDLLSKQFQHYGADFSGLLFGWPSAPTEPAATLAATLEQAEYRDLPVVVMSTDMRAETRAWAAGRDNTAVLSWREYQGLEPLLQRLIDVTPDDTDTFPAKFDNSDIRLLIVDDSATIRYSLRDLFQLQGYQVSLAATQDEALDLATKNRLDIAILDFYLTETTGDLLCRALMSNHQVGDIVCTVLTGTYSDHIIKRSLRAGAVECMFKNESSELLLSRIDAISRFVRQRRVLETEHRMLEDIIQSVAGAVLIIDSDHRISYANAAALEQLQLETGDSIVGQPSETLLELDAPGEPGPTVHTATWRLPTGGALDVDYEHTLITPKGPSLIRFVQKKISMSPTSSDNRAQVPGELLSAEALMQHFELADTSEPFITKLQDYIRDLDTLDVRISLLVMDVFVRQPDDTLRTIDDHEGLADTVQEQLHAIYKRPGHVAALGRHRFGFLLRHHQDSQAYLLVRKIMQLCLEMAHGVDNVTLACTGSLLCLNEHTRQPITALLQHSFKGLDLVGARGLNQALLLDLRRMLSAYPVPITPPDDTPNTDQ